MNITAEQNPPTRKETKAEFKRLSKLNQPFVKGSFATIAEPFGCTAQSVKNLLLDPPAKWKPYHYQIWEACKGYVKKC